MINKFYFKNKESGYFPIHERNVVQIMIKCMLNNDYSRNDIYFSPLESYDYLLAEDNDNDYEILKGDQLKWTISDHLVNYLCKISSLSEKISNIEEKLNNIERIRIANIERSFESYSNGVQNVYDEFEELNKKLKLREFNKLIKRIDALEEAVQDLALRNIERKKK